MSSKDVRKGVTNAKFNEDNIGILSTEIWFLSVGLGLWLQSWWVFGASLLGFIVAMWIKPLAILLCICLSVLWGLAGYIIGTLIGNVGAQIVLCILGLLISGGIHISALEWVEDIGTGCN